MHTYPVMVQHDPVLQTFVLLHIGDGQEIPQGIDLKLVKGLVDGRIEQTLQLDYTGLNLCFGFLINSIFFAIFVRAWSSCCSLFRRKPKLIRWYV